MFTPVGFFASGRPNFVTTGLYQYINPIGSTVSASVVSDLSGNNRNGTLDGGIAAVSDGWQLGSGKSINLGNISSPLFSADFTLEVWIKIPTTGDFSSDAGFLYMYNTSGRPQVGLGINTEYGGFKVIMGVRNNSASPDFGNGLPGTTNGTAGQQFIGNGYHQHVMTRIGTTFTQYIDGVSTTTVTSNQGSLTSGRILESGGPIGTFRRFYSSSVRLGLTRLYDVGLTAAQVVQNYEANEGLY